jgi:hypothetical protein
MLSSNIFHWVTGRWMLTCGTVDLKGWSYNYYNPYNYSCILFACKAGELSPPRRCFSKESLFEHFQSSENTNIAFHYALHKMNPSFIFVLDGER